MDRPVGLINLPFWKSATTVRTGMEPRTAIGLLLAVILLTLVGLLYLDQAASVTEARAQIDNLRQEQVSLAREARYLQARIAEQSSLSRSMARASALGLHQPQQVVKLTVSRGGAPAGEARVAAPAGEPATALPWWYAVVNDVQSWVADATGGADGNLVASAGGPR